MKAILLLLFIALASAETGDEKLQCNFRFCGVDLLNFHSFSFSSMFRKLELANFCIKNCTPPVVHEFFQSITFAIMRRIPGHCSGQECVEKNRFVALAKCMEEHAWPLLQCSKRLVDLAQVALNDHSDKQKRNYTCMIVVETTQCIEEILVECGRQPFELVKEIAGDVIKLGISVYCQRSTRNDFFEDFDKTTTLAPYQDRMKHFTDISPATGLYPYPAFVKGYRNSVTNTQTLSFVCLIFSFLFSGMHLYRYR